MESKTKRDINEYFKVPEGPPSPVGNREIIHLAKTRTLLPTTPYGLINTSPHTLGVNMVSEVAGNETKYTNNMSSPQKLLQHSTSLSSRPHTAGPLFSKSTHDSNLGGVPPNVHFIRIKQPSGPLIVPVSPFLYLV